MPSSKVRFDGLDVCSMVSHVQRVLLGRRLINIYDGISESGNDSFLMKLDASNSSATASNSTDRTSTDGKQVLFLESGIRFHTTHNSTSLQAEGMPSPFCSKLRKHLRGLRLERIQQLGKMDRVVLFIFGSGVHRHALILELYARGNVILTNADYSILALLRSHEYENQVSVRVGHVYPVTHATSMELQRDEAGEKQNGHDHETSEQAASGLLHRDMKGEAALAWATAELQARLQDVTGGNTKKKSPSAMPLKALLLRPSSGVYHFGPSLVEHCILCAELDPNTKLTVETVAEKMTIM